MRRNRGFTLVELPAVSPSKRGAFTLVELLVVIGIIALLISILLPSLASARRQAMRTKCAAQMHDMGSAMLMYVQDNKGYLPSVQISTKYTIDSLTYGKGLVPEVYNVSVNENAKWWHFIAKYVTKKKPMPQPGDNMSDFMNSTFWCPAWGGYTDNTGAAVNMIDGINRNLPGIGMNWYPTSSGSLALPTNTPTDTINTSEKFANATTTPGGGKWYKLSQLTHPSERALLGDSRQFYIETEYLPPGSTIPGQRSNSANNDYSSGIAGQSMFDFYRHGVYPTLANSDPKNGYFATTGGKIGYNILFSDMHVESPSDRETGYRASRMLFPG